MATTRSVDTLLNRYPDTVQRLAAGARQLIRRVLPKAEERADSSAPVIAYGYGPGYRGMVCTLILSKSGVKLGLVRGGELADPHGLLAGSGRVHRYIALRTREDLRRPGVSDLIKATHAAWRKRAADARSTAPDSLHSQRNATVGSTRAARRAGNQLASAPTLPTTPTDKR
jgi:hypothetical protein